MKTLLSVNITESQKGEFPDLGPISLGHFRLSQISLSQISLISLHFLQRSGATIRRMLGLVLWSAVGCQL
jgi:hypothetical protein